MRSIILYMKLGALAAAVALAGCLTTSDDGHHADDHSHGDGGHHDGATQDGDGNRAYTGNEDVQWSVTAGRPEEYRFDPDTFPVQAGQSVGVTLRNDGDVAHEVSIRDFGFHLHVEPGETLQAAFIAGEPGTYTFGCYIPGHFEAGMKGSLEVGA